MKTFKDLKFKNHPTGFPDSGHAILNFDNGYGVSVIYGSMFYSSGKGSYELAVLYKGELTYNTHITNDVIGYQSGEQVTKIMEQVQQLK